MNEILMRAVVQSAAFLELSSDDQVDPDAAVGQFEAMAHLLKQLSDTEKRQFVAFVNTEAKAGGPAEYVEFLMRFPDAIGISL